MARDREVLKAAAELFYEKGFHGVGVDEIGERVGVTGPALYRHFSGKDEILATLFNEALDELISATASVYDDPFDDLDRLIRHHVEFALEERHLVNVYIRETRSLVEPWRRQFLRRIDQYASRWEAALARCYPDAPDEAIVVATQAALGLLHSIAHWPPKALKVDSLVDLLSRLVTEGLSTLADAAAVNAARRGRASGRRSRA